MGMTARTEGRALPKFGCGGSTAGKTPAATQHLLVFSENILRLRLGFKSVPQWFTGSRSTTGT
jgi:hypothetical protein